MRRLLYIAILTAGMLAGTGAPARAQQQAPPSLDALWQAYQAFDYAQAQSLAEVALAAYEAPEELAQVHVVLGLIAFSQNEPDAATRHFTDALVLDPSIRLDPLLVSPKILEFFDAIRAQQAARSQDARPATQPEAPRYVLVPDRRAEAALRSMVLPGWGQLYKGQRTKGRLLLGAWGLTLAATAGAHLVRQQSRQEYLDAVTPAEALDRYDTFNQWHKTRNALVLGAAAVWVYSYLDALISGGVLPEERGFVVSPAFTGGRVQGVVRVRF